MQEQQFWQFVQQKLAQNLRVILLLVPESKGSSPGRQGHKMAVSEDAALYGTIGGGEMEYQQVERCKKMFQNKPSFPIYQHLVHDKKDKAIWSGLSCSGEQTILTFFLEVVDLNLVNSIVDACQKEMDYSLIFYSNNRIKLESVSVETASFNYYYENAEQWSYQYVVSVREKVYLIGAGHVGLALCRQLALLDFQVILIDNRASLPTQEYEQFITKKIITNYKKVGELVQSTIHDYIVIMSFSSALDTLILSQLIDKPCRYIGMMASQIKADRIRDILLEKGFTKAQYERVHTPIGLPIKCKSPAEIAVSVAGQMITIKNDTA